MLFAVLLQGEGAVSRQYGGAEIAGVDIEGVAKQQ